MQAGKRQYAPARILVNHFASESNVRREQVGKMQDAVMRAQQRSDRIEKTGATFLITDLRLAMTLTHIASEADVESEKRARNQANARHAYDDVSRISLHVSLTNNERQD